MRRLAIVLLALAGCGGGEGSPAEVVPADATMYLSVATDARLPYLGRPADELVHAAAGLGPLTDVRPWAGERVAVFTHRSGLGMAIPASDEEAAVAFARRTRFRHARVIDGHLVLATTPELLRAAEGSEGYDAPAEEGQVVLLVFDNTSGLYVGERTDVIPQGTQDVLQRLLPAEGTTTVRVRRDRRAVNVQVTGLGAPLPPAPSLEDLPSAAWLAIASGDTGRTVLGTLAIMSWVLGEAEDVAGFDVERDVLEHLGPGRFFVQGLRETDLGARLLAETTDEPALRRAARTFARNAEGTADLNVNRPGDPEPFLQLDYAREDAEPGDLLGGFFLEIDSGRFDLQLGEATDGVAGDLPDTPHWKDAVRRLGGEPTTLLDLAALWESIDGPGRSPWVDPGAYVALRDAGEDGRRVIRAVAVPAG